MKILWLCHCPLSDSDSGKSVTWLGAMARGLMDSDSVELGIIALGPVKQFTRRDFRQVKQWLVPKGITLGRDGLPQASLVRSIVSVAKEFSPDVVHIWGTESFWGLLPARGMLTCPSLLEIQGLKGQIAEVFYGGLTFSERLSSVGIKELLLRRTMRADRRDFRLWGLYEEEIIRGHRFVDVQSPWVVAHIAALNPAARMFMVNLPLRGAFYDADAWQTPGRPTLFSSAAYSSPFKGLHVAVRALALLRKRIPEVRLRIAGAHQNAGLRQDGYMRWVNRMIRQLGLVDAIEWLGPLSADKIVIELRNAAAVIIPSFIENCCTAMQEAMAIGTPVVVSYVGGIPSLAKDEDSCLFFPPGDVTMCAYQLERVLTDDKLARRLSSESRKIAIVRNNRQRITQQQLEIYHQILAEQTIDGLTDNLVSSAYKHSVTIGDPM